jgi:hypothetical protein
MMRRRARRAFLIRSGHAKQAQSHRTIGSANNELCRVERSCRGPAGARARRQGDHDPGAYGRGSTPRAALRRRPPSRRLCLPIMHKPPPIGCASDEQIARPTGDRAQLGSTRSTVAPPRSSSTAPRHWRWKTHAAALLERRSISLGVMLESDWRQLYIRGVMPEDAADQAYAHYWITRGFEQMGKR